MKPTDAAAIVAGSSAGAVLADSIEQILASAAAAVAVYLVKAGMDYIRRKIGPISEDNDPPEDY